MPLLITGFAAPLYSELGSEAGQTISGADFALPSMSVMFAFFLLNFIGFSFMREHGWRTWDRLRAAPIADYQLLMGKCAVGWALAIAQQVVLFSAGAVLFDVRIHGTILGAGFVIIALATAIVMLAMALLGVVRTVGQLSSLTYLATLVLGGLGGAFGAVEDFPAWAEVLARFSPAYWGIQGLRDAIADPGLSEPAGAAAVLLGFAVAGGALANRTLRLSERKLAWA